MSYWGRMKQVKGPTRQVPRRTTGVRTEVGRQVRVRRTRFELGNDQGLRSIKLLKSTVRKRTLRKREDIRTRFR